LTLSEQLNYVKRMAREHVTVDEMRADFANGFGRKTVESSGLAAQPIGNTDKEPMGQVPPDPKNPGKAGAFGVSEDVALGLIGTPNFVSQAAGITVAMTDGVVVKAEDQGRIDRVKTIVNKFGY